MDPKLKLNAKMNILMKVIGFWLSIAKLSGKLHNFVLNKATSAQKKEFDILREMLNEDYSESYKSEIREVLKM